MKNVLKKTVIFSFVFTFLSASVFCCCIPGFALAQETVPECHQTSHETNDTQDHNTEDCDCPVITSITIEKINNSFDLTKLAFHSDSVSYHEYDSYTPIVPAYQAPPQYYDSIPLYIKHSILRI